MKLSRLIIYSSARGGRVTVKLLWRDDRDKQATLKVADADHDAATSRYRRIAVPASLRHLLQHVLSRQYVVQIG